MQPIPPTLAPFFQEYDLAALNPQKNASTVIERTLQFGNRAEIRWLFGQYSRAQIAGWVEKYAKTRLPEPHYTFWKMMLETNP